VEWRRINIVIGSSIIWFLSQIHWLSSDKLIRDGDEEGHVGAAEMFKDWFIQGEYTLFLSQLFWGDLGEYPPFFAAYVGFWWGLFDVQPENLLLRATILLFPISTALFCAWYSKRKEGPWDVIFVITLFIPLTNGLARHYMIENPLHTFMALFLLCLSIERKQGYLGAGLVLGISLLCKQTTILYAAPLFLIFYANLHWILLGSLIAFPWYFLHFGDQSQYIQSSITSPTSPNILESIGAPFASLFWENIGFVGLLIFILVCKTLLMKTKGDVYERKFWLVFAVTMLVFILLPKKYPRLMVGVLPLVVLLFNDILKHESRRTQHFIMTLMIGQYFYFSFLPSPPNLLREVSDDRCPQIWNRPPYDSDLGLQEVYTWIQTQDQISHIRMYVDPIPCKLQTTHGYPYHVEIYLRRRGIDVTIEEVDNKKNAMIIWSEQTQIFR
jgi:hypothetical protein